jgi:hypothetical protein
MPAMFRCTKQNKKAKRQIQGQVKVMERWHKYCESVATVMFCCTKKKCKDVSRSWKDDTSRSNQLVAMVMHPVAMFSSGCHDRLASGVLTVEWVEKVKGHVKCRSRLPLSKKFNFKFHMVLWTRAISKKS